MTRPLVHEYGSNASKDGNEGDQPPRETDHADVQAVSVPGSGEDGPDRPEGGRHGLSDAVDRTQHGRVR